MSEKLEQLTTEIRAFLDGITAQDDWDRAAAGFGTQFLSLDPTTVAVVTREQLRGALPGRASLFEQAGASGTTLASLEVTELDDLHVLAETGWFVERSGVGRAPLQLHS